MGVKGIETCHEIIWSKFLSLNVNKWKGQNNLQKLTFMKQKEINVLPKET